jgi:xeroderma pigmentosum group C-complementing protein
MAGRKRNASANSSSTRATRASSRRAAQAAASAVPDVYRAMLAEARSEIAAQSADSPERPLKRKRPGEGRRATTTSAQTSGSANTPASQKPPAAAAVVADDTPQKHAQQEGTVPAPTVQTIMRDSDDDDEDDELDFEDVPIQPTASSAGGDAGGASEGLSLDLSAHLASLLSRRTERRKGINRQEKARRIEIHKVHLVCLLAHVEIRNRWCNDPRVRDALRPLLPQKTVSSLIPRASLNQFSRSESLKKGLQEARDWFRLKFSITERGLWRALWAENEQQIKDVRSSLSPCWGLG